MNAQPQLLHARTAFYPRDRRSVRRARQFTREVLADWMVTERVDDVLLCVSELANNALLYGVPPGRGYLLRLTLATGSVLRAEVHDSGSGEFRAPQETPHAEQGRGLLLVTALADKWGVWQRNPGKVVWCEFGPAPCLDGSPRPQLTHGVI